MTDQWLKLEAKTEGPIPRTIRLADELDRLQMRVATTRILQDTDTPEKQRVVAARRVKLSGW